MPVLKPENAFPNRELAIGNWELETEIEIADRLSQPENVATDQAEANRMNGMGAR